MVWLDTVSYIIDAGFGFHFPMFRTVDAKISFTLRQGRWVTFGLIVLIIALLQLISLWVYRGVAENQLVWDSVHYIEFHEEHIASVSVSNLHWMLTSLEMSNWHPLTWFSWALDYQLYGGIDPKGLHRTSVVIHGINSGLVFILMLMLFRLSSVVRSGEPVEMGFVHFIIAFLVASLFAVHPQHVESVAWVAERKDVLCLMMMLLSLMSYLRYGSTQQNSKWRWYWISLFFTVLAAMAKPMAVSLPIVMIFLDYYPLYRLQPLAGHGRMKVEINQVIVEKIPFILLSVGLALITLVAQQGAIATVPFEVRFFNAFNSYLAYISKLLLPVVLSPQYSFPIAPDHGLQAQHFVPLLGFAGISALTLLLASKGKRAWLSAWGIYVVSLIPVIGLVSVGNAAMADRYAYFPTLPFYLLLGGGLIALFQGRTVLVKLVVSLLVVVICIVFALKTNRQVSIWKDEISLWSQAVKASPTDGIARINFATALIQVRAFEQALVQLNIADTLPYHKTMIYAWRVIPLAALDRFDDALEDLQNMRQSSLSEPGIRIDWNCFEYNIGWLNARLGGYEEAGKAFALVDEQSRFSEESNDWLRYLKGSATVRVEQAELERLPGFCPALLADSWDL